MKNFILCLTLAAASGTQAQSVIPIVSIQLAQEQATVFQLRSDISAAASAGKNDNEIAAIIASASSGVSNPTILAALQNTLTLSGASKVAVIGGITGGRVQAAINNGASDEQVAAIIADAVALNPEAATEIQAAVEAAGASEVLVATAIITGLSNAEAPAAGPTNEAAPATPAPARFQSQGPSIPVSNTPGGISPN